jgi:hypothetical protein
MVPFTYLLNDFGIIPILAQAWKISGKTEIDVADRKPEIMIKISTIPNLKL